MIDTKKMSVADMVAEANKYISGKVVAGVCIDDHHMDDWLIVGFMDGTELRIRYDWIYELQMANRTDKR